MDISENGHTMVTAATGETILHDPDGASRTITEDNADVHLSPDGDQLISIVHGTITLYDRDGESQWQRTMETAEGNETEIAGSGVTDGFESVTTASVTSLVALSMDDAVLWETGLPSGRVWEADTSPSGEYAIARTEDREDEPENEDAIHVAHDGEHIWSDEFDEPPIRAAISNEIAVVGLDDGRLLVYDLDGDIRWTDQDLGGFFELSQNGETLLTHDVENTIAFDPDGNEQWTHNEVGLWWYDAVDISSSGRSIARYEDATEGVHTANVYDGSGDVVWQDEFESRDVSVKISGDGRTWMISTDSEIDVYHDYDG
ncbi:hypothetical protein CYV19_13005 [Natronobacterium gregoryi SP2]|nr:hypothetical protein CYV19_13005 [Natronobacterium gregoryi SP2]